MVGLIRTLAGATGDLMLSADLFNRAAYQTKSKKQLLRQMTLFVRRIKPVYLYMMTFFTRTQRATDLGIVSKHAVVLQLQHVT